jgi:hypothetical protein
MRPATSSSPPRACCSAPAGIAAQGRGGDRRDFGKLPLLVLLIECAGSTVTFARHHARRPRAFGTHDLRHEGATFPKFLRQGESGSLRT